MDLRQVVHNVTLTKVCSIKPFKGSNESKQVTLEISFDGVLLEDVFAKAVGGAVIQWQNGPGRKQFNQWENGQLVKVSFKAPGKTAVDPEALMKAKLQSMDEGDREAYLRKMLESL